MVNVTGAADGDDDSRLMLKSLRSEGERLFLLKKKGVGKHFFLKKKRIDHHFLKRSTSY